MSESTINVMTKDDLDAFWSKLKGWFVKAPTATVTADTVALFDGITGKIIKSSGKTIETSATQSSSNLITSGAVWTGLNGKLSTTLKGAANGLAELDANGLVPSSQLPSYVDDVLEYASKSAFPATGETGKIYVALDTNLTYRWSGSAYVEISPSLALGETSSTAYRGDRGAIAYSHATDANRLTTAQTSGFYKFATTSEGHIASVTAVTASDLTTLIGNTTYAPYNANGYLPMSGGTMANTNLVTNLNAEYLGGTKKADLFSVFENSNEQVSATIGGTNKKLTIDYATKALKMKQEVMADQEFIFRNSPKTIDTDSMRLDRIKGKTLVWNQIIQGYQVTTDGTVVKNANGSYTFKKTGSGTSQPYWWGTGDVSIVVGHKYLLSYRPISVPTGFKVYEGMTGTYISFTSSKIVTATQSNHKGLIDMRQCAQNAVATIYYQVFDLTLMFGSGKEPSTVADFEKYYFGAFAYNEGELINNSAKSIESVEFNLWDEEWEAGTYDSATGQKLDNPTYAAGKIRSNNYIPVLPNTTYYVGKSGFMYWEYDADKNYIMHSNSTGETPINGLFTTTTNCRYINFRVTDTSYNNDICINLSDTSKNGTYEPYKKTITDLNLQEIRVKSPNIWDEEWSTQVISSSDGEQTGSYNLCISSLNHIKVNPNGEYYIKCSYGNNNGLYIKQFDEDFVPLSDNWDFLGITNAVIRISQNARYIKFMTLASYGATYNNDICINKSGAGFNGRYFPHGVLTFNGLKSAGSVYDEITNGGRTLIRRVGDVDMGTLTWLFYSESFYVNVTNKASRAGGYSDIRLITPKYATIPANPNMSGMSDKSIWEYTALSGPKRICVKDTSYSGNATTFKTAMSGVYLNYELDHYETYELVEPIPMSLPSGTTERRLPEDTADSVIAPFCADITYGVNNGDILTDVSAIGNIVKTHIQGDKLFSEGLEVATIGGVQALTNKTYNGLTLTAQSTGFTIAGGTTSKTLTVNESYTLGAACAKSYTDSSLASAIGTGTSLVTERDVYYGLPTINGAHNYTSNTNIYAPNGAGTAGQILKSTAGTPEWINQSAITAGALTTVSKTLFGNTYWTSGGVPTSIGTSSSPAALNYVTNIDSLLYFDRTNNRVGVGTSSPSEKLAVDGNATVYGKVTASNDITSVRNIYALGGMAAYGIATLDMSGGTLGVTQVNVGSTAYTPTNGIVSLPAYPTWSTLTGKPSLAAVATSGDYDDLTNKPTNLSDFTNDASYLTNMAFETKGGVGTVTGNVNTLTYCTSLAFTTFTATLPTITDTTKCYVVMFYVHWKSGYNAYNITSSHTVTFMQGFSIVAGGAYFIKAVFAGHWFVSAERVE